MFIQNTADQDLQSPPDLSSGYGVGPHALDTPGSGLGDNQKEPDPNSGLEPPKGKIWGMKRRTFMIVLGIFILLIIAVAAGVGGGVAKAITKSNVNDVASESMKPDPQGLSSTDSKPQGSSTPTDSKPQGSSTPTDSKPESSSTPTSSSSSPSTVSIYRPTTTTVTSSISSSPSPTPIRKNSPFAAVNWGTSNIQLFYKHTDGTIRLQEKSGLGWGGEQSLRVTKPKDDSGLAVIGWSDGSVRQIRVYTAGANNALIESVWNSSAKLWSDQDISTGKGIAPLAAGSHLTAIVWSENKGLRIRVYYQGQDGYIREAAFDSGGNWWKGGAPTIQDFPRAKSGTGLAIVSFPDTDVNEAKLFYQRMDGKLASYDYKPAATWVQSWKNQDSTIDHGSIPDGAQVAAVISRSGTLTPGDLTLRIYFIRDGKLVEIWWTRKAGWNSWYMRNGNAAAPNAAAIYYSDDVNVFFQSKTEYISALSLNRFVDTWQFTAII